MIRTIVMSECMTAIKRRKTTDIYSPSVLLKQRSAENNPILQNSYM